MSAKPLGWFELGRLLYVARIREAWNFGAGYADRRLEDNPYPRHPADADLRAQSAGVELAQAEAKALLKAGYTVLPPEDAAS